MSVTHWQAPYAVRPVVASVRIPGSKSETNRAYLLAALCDAPSTVTGALSSRDTQLMRTGLQALGTQFQPLHQLGGNAAPTPTGVNTSASAALIDRVIPAQIFTPVPDGIDVGLAGTVMRFLPAVAALAPGLTRFYGDTRAAERPLAPLLHALASLGVEFEGTQIPFAMHSPTRLRGREVSIDASQSSQFVSALLLAGARYPEGIALILRGGQVPSRPHIDMTIAMLRARGVAVEDTAHTFNVAPGTIAAVDQVIAPDLTNAAAFLSAGLLTEGRVEVLDWPEQTTQPGNLFLDIITQFGGQVERTASGVSAHAELPLTACDLDLSAASELAPVVAALAAFSQGTSRITGISHVRGHETDRIAAIVTTLRTVGTPASELPDGFRITGTAGIPTPTQPVVLPTYADHRIAQLAALLGLRIPGIRLEDVATTAKTMPQFPKLWRTMVTGGDE
ncbi:MAG: 3-phosphoshikimate 1-carboxyvinyltransferase [Propionibacteriaceae bacterium]|nr:3-phosphoshikimate 1-carboxyvinyltransferase [Propionibacteriaceae bacterium]